MKKNKVVLIILILLIFIVSFVGAKGEVIENLDVPIGVGVDSEANLSNRSYIISMLIQTFEGGNKTSSNVITGEAKSFGETREERQLKESKKIVLGLIRVFFFGEGASRNGIKTFIDVNLNNPDLNDRAVCVVCKGNARDMLQHKVKGYTSSAEYVEGMVKNLEQFNFFKQQYTVLDMIVRVDAEGRNLLLPYIELKDGEIQTTGLAIFNKDKMIGKADIKDTKMINLLKENNVKGMLTLQQSPKKFINFYAKSKRKANCYMENGKYKFIIDLKLTGSIIGNELYENMNTEPKKVKEFERDIEKSTEQLCNETIGKIKNNYKVDVLDLGEVAAAKYGRGKGIDWNDVVTKSDIQVRVHAKVSDQGRGDY